MAPHERPLVNGNASGAEQVVEWAEWGRAVKAFNTAGVDNRPIQTMRSRLCDPDYENQRLAVLIAGDSVEAKGTVSELADALGFETVDTGRCSVVSVVRWLALDGSRLLREVPLSGRRESGDE